MKKKWVIKLSEIPNEKVIHSYLYEKTDILKHVEKFKNHKTPDYTKVPLNLNINELQKSVNEAIQKFGLHSFSYNGSKAEEGVYMSSSLTWNSCAVDSISSNPHEATLGSSFHKYGSASLYENDGKGRDTYKDSFSFCEVTPFSQHGLIKKLTDSFSRTLVRSRVSVLMGNRPEATKFNFGWHNDELVFINMRVNIPVVSNENFSIQLIQNEKGDSLDIIDFKLETGFAFVYDTSKNHRPVLKKMNDQDRINMIYGVSPWFDFDPVEKIWFSNEYYGEVHPFEMLELGLISNLVNQKS